MVVAALVGPFAGAVQAQPTVVLVGNGAGASTAFIVGTVGEQHLALAQQFTTGPSATGGFRLTRVGLYFSRNAAAETSQFAAVIHEDAAGSPGDALYTLNNPAGNFGQSTARANFGAPDNAELAANRSYWLVVTNNNGIDGNYVKLIGSAVAESSDSQPGWSIANVIHLRDSTSGPWSSNFPVLGMEVEGSVLRDNTERVKLSSLELHDHNDNTVPINPPELQSSQYNEAFVDLETDIVTITATPVGRLSTIRYRRGDDTTIEDADTNKDGHQVELWSHENVIRMKVTSPSGEVAYYYKLTVWRLGSLTQQPATGRPVISGTPRVGETLTVSMGNVDDPNGTHFAETGKVVNYIKNGFRFSSRWVNKDGEDPNVVRNSRSGASRVLEKIDVGRQIVAKVCFRDDLGNTECRLSEPTARVAGEQLVIENTSRVITGSLCDYVYPAGPDCATETSARKIGGRIKVFTKGTNVNMTSFARLTLMSKTVKKITRDEFGNLHEVDYHFELGDDKILRTVVGKAYPFLEAPLCPRDENPPHACQGGRSSIANWQIDSVDVEVRATLDGGSLVDRYATARIPVMITSHDTARRIRSGSDRRCANARCYGRKLTPGQTLYKDNATEPTTRSIGQPPPPNKPPKGNVGKGIGEEPQETALTASFENLPREHDGETPFEFNLVFDQEVYEGTEAVNKNKAVRQALTVTGGRVTGGRRLVKEKFDVYVIKVTPDGHETVTIKLEPPSDACTPATPTCTPDGVRLGKAVTDTVKGLTTISVNGDEVQEGSDAALEFTVELSREAGHEITVDYETVDGTAEAGIDYVATSGVLTFNPGETEKTVSVLIRDDSVDEGTETMTLRLSDATDAYILQSEATGKIKNSDLMPHAWLGRFGRTVAEQVLDAVEGRIRSAPPAGTQVTVAGQRLGGEAPDAETLEEADAKARLEGLSAWLAGETQAREGRTRSREVAPRELLTGSSFALTTRSEGLGGGVVSLWGRGAVSRFDGREEELTLDGEVTGALLGADWTRERWTAGLMLSHARGEGGYRASSRSEGNRESDSSGSGSGTSGDVTSTVTGLYPYGRYKLTERVTVWGAAGYGAGTLTLTPDGGEALGTDMDLAMAAAGLRGVVIEAPAEGGAEVAVKTDALGVRTTSEAVRGEAVAGSAGAGGNLAAATADVTRLRLGLEGTWRGLGLGTGAFEPRFEVGVRHDGGDAETGFGLDLGGGLAWSNPGTGLRAEASGRGLLTHEAGGFGERGFAGAFGWDPSPGTERGPSLTVRQTVGLSASGGADALFGRTTLAGLAAHDDGAELERRRLEVKLGYGVGAFGDRFTARPEAGLEMSQGHREYGLGWRLVRERRGGDLDSLELGLEARRRESAGATGPGSGAVAPPEHRVELRLVARW